MTQQSNSPSTTATTPSASGTAAQPRLTRVLGLGDLVFYGIVLIQPIGAVGIFGLAEQKSFGHVTTAILIALVAMMLTAMSYGRMAGLYPAAGSAYAYVGRGLHPHLGFIAGWAMFLDYLVIPIISVIYGALSMQKIMDELAPGFTAKLVSGIGFHHDAQKTGFVFWVILFLFLMMFFNLRGIKWTAHANVILTVVMCLVVVMFVVEAVRYLWMQQGVAGLLSTKPFFDPHTFNLRAVGMATSLAALTYIGFDGITTLAEEVKEPKRTVPLAVVLVCLFIGLCAGLQMYLAHLVWPDYTSFKDPNTAFFDVCKLVGGATMLNTMALILAIACIGSAWTGQVGAARILFGMGRDKALPGFFARLNSQNNPVLNIWIIGILTLIGSLSLKYEDAADLVNFGALIAFMGVNLAVIREFWLRKPAGHRPNLFLDLVAPALGFLTCLGIWIGLPILAMKVGSIWLAVGLIYAGFNTRGFTKPPKIIDLNV